MPALLTPRLIDLFESRDTGGSLHSERREVFRHVLADEITLAVWERELPRNVSRLCVAWAQKRDLLELDVTAAAGRAMAEKLPAHPLFANNAQNSTLRWLVEDILRLAESFSELVSVAEVRVRLTGVADDGCAAFHVDTLPIRLLCTYAGKGTQWVNDADACREELGLRRRTVDEANAAVVPHPTRIRTMRTGAVAVFKGRLWPGAEDRGLIHCSHPVCCGDHARLRLVIDPAGFAY